MRLVRIRRIPMQINNAIIHRMKYLFCKFLCDLSIQGCKMPIGRSHFFSLNIWSKYLPWCERGATPINHKCLKIMFNPNELKITSGLVLNALQKCSKIITIFFVQHKPLTIFLLKLNYFILWMYQHIVRRKHS